MKSYILILVVTAIVLICGAWLLVLRSGAAAEFQELFDGFGVALPEITKMLFSSLEIWWAFLVPIALLSYLPLFIFKGKWKYTSIIVSALFLVTLVGAVYGPIFAMGAVL